MRVGQEWARRWGLPYQILEITVRLSLIFSSPDCVRVTDESCLGSGLSWFNWWVSFAPEFRCCYFCGSSCLFCLGLNSDFYVSKIVRL